MAPDEIKTKYTFDNRELSWLRFNNRVLEEAEDYTVPLWERLSFLTIYSSNLDEFMKVRIGKLHHSVLNDTKGKAFIKDKGAANVLAKVYKKAAEAQDRADRDFEEVEKFLAQGEFPVVHLRPEQLTEKDREWLAEYSRTVLCPLLEPIVLDKRQPFPLYGSKNIIAGCIISKKKTARSVGLIEVPAETPRVVFFPADKGLRYMLVEELILFILPMKFNEWDIESSGLFAMLENADISESPALYPCETSPRNVMEKILRRRDLQAPAAVKLYGPDSDMLGEWLQKALLLEPGRIPLRKMPLNMKYTGEIKDRLPAEYKKQITNPPRPARIPDWAEGSLMDKVLEKDRLLIYPYNDIEVFVRFLEEACTSPRVKAVSITLYRVAKDSRVAKALIKAAEAGKRVTVLVELRARFDEANNVYWSKKLEAAGADIIYGIPEFKVHSKVLLVELGGSEEGKCIMQFGTGNYNEITSHIYTDCALLTADKELAEDASAFFEALKTGRFVEKANGLLVAPLILKQSVSKMIEEETQKALRGEKARIWLKMNSVSDKNLMKQLIEASKAGVDVRLCVRGLSCLIAGANADSIEVRSIVGRYLEHARIYCFGTGENTKIYISSADFMTRNTEKRVEVAAPVRDKELRDRLVRMLEITFADNVKARIMTDTGNYIRPVPEGEKINSQNQLFDL